MKTHPIYIFDFDSTIIQVESLDELAMVALRSNPNRDEIEHQIKNITTLAMSGRYSYQESLSERFELLELNKNHIEETVSLLKNKISTSILRNINFFKQNAHNIYVVTGAFFDIVWPIAKTLGLLESNIYANQLLYDCTGKIRDYIRSNPLSQDQGKVKLIQQLELTNPVVMIGDGYNDYEVKEANLASTFVAYCENIKRNEVIDRADAVIDSMEGLFITCNIMQDSEHEHPKVLLLENIHSNVEQYFTELGYEVKSLSSSLSETELSEIIKNVQILGIRSKTQITEKILKNAEKLLAIGAFCIGTNQINMSCASENGIAIFNAPFSNTRSVVELTIAEIIMLMRRIPEANTNLHQGKWIKASSNSNEIRGKTLAIIGYGKIGSQLSILAESMGMNVIFYDIEEKLPLGNAIASKSLLECISNADVVTLHVDGRQENKNLINDQIFSAMKDNVIFLNLSRDHCVDLNALVKHLKTNKIKGAAIDVFPNEPLKNQEDFKSSLQNFHNTLLTPHIGGSTEEAQRHIGQCVFNYLNEYYQNGNTTGSVNIPAISIPNILNCTRLLHIHHNVPGILAKINKILSEHQVNVEAQLLKTNESIGYVITDINQSLSDNVITELKKIEHTVKLRVLPLQR